MTTAIENSELDTELQELYLVNKQWLSDLEFLDTEFEFLGKLAATAAVAVVRNEELNSLNIIENSYAFLKKDVLAYLHRLEPLIVAESKKLDLNFLEDFIQLKTRLADMFAQCSKLKKEIFDTSKAGLIEGHISIE